MKKIITLLFCTAVFTSAFAQQNRRDGDDKNANTNQKVFQNSNDRDDKKFDNHGMYDSRYNISQRDMQIQRITSQYDFKIQQVSNDRYLSRRQKRFTIQNLQSEKARAISDIIARFNSNVYNDHSRNNDYRQNGHR